MSLFEYTQPGIFQTFDSIMSAAIHCCSKLHTTVSHVLYLDFTIFIVPRNEQTPILCEDLSPAGC